MIIFLQEEADQYDQLYAALETCDTNQIMQERDNLRLRIKAVDEEHVQAKLVCGHIQVFVKRPIPTWWEWCDQCKDFRKVIEGVSR